MQVKELSGSALAYLGDAVWSLWVREHLLLKGYQRADDLAKKAVAYNSAKGQAKIVYALMEQAFLSEEELDIYKRGRNHKSKSVAKNADVITYRTSTGFEALIGYWYLAKNQTRIQQVMEIAKEVVGQ